MSMITSAVRRRLRRYAGIKAFLVRQYPRWIAFLHRVWILRNRLTPGRPVSVTTRGVEVRLYPSGQIAEMVWADDFEPWERDFVATYVKPGMRVVNIGANIGLYTILCSKLVGESGEVHAFEPSMLTHSRLRRNLELNGCRNVTSNRVALSSADGELVLRADPANINFDGHRFVQEVSTVGRMLATDEIVQCKTLDGHFGASIATPANIDLAIIDVEGAESRVLGGARELLATSPNLTILVECSQDLPAVEGLLAEQGFSFFGWDMTARALTPLSFAEAASRGNLIARRQSWRGSDAPSSLSARSTAG